MESKQPVTDWKVYSRLPRREKHLARQAIQRAFTRNLRAMDAAIAGGERLEVAVRRMFDAMEDFGNSGRNPTRYPQAVVDQVSDAVVTHSFMRHGREPVAMVVWADEYLLDWKPGRRVLPC